MAAAADLDDIKNVNSNRILMANLQQASTSGSQADKALVYDSDGSAENDSNVISEASSVEHGGEIVEQHPKTVEQTDAYHESIFHNLAAEVEKFNTIDETHALSKPVTSNSIPTTKESKIVENEKVISPEMFRIDPRKTSREDKFFPINNVISSIRTNPITISQPHVITKKVVNSNKNSFSSTGVDITTKTKRPQPRSNKRNDRVLSASKSSRIKNKEVKVEDHHRNLPLSTNKIHMSSECNNIKLTILNDKSKVVCAMCKQCLITTNHDVCVLNHVNDMNSRGTKQKEKLSNIAKQTKPVPYVKKPKNVGSNDNHASPKPSKLRSFLRWSPTRRTFNCKGKLIATSKSECQSDSSGAQDREDVNFPLLRINVRKLTFSFLWGPSTKPTFT
nr:hypothetical protein [Tanacetum cinerariifolium]